MKHRWAVGRLVAMVAAVTVLGGCYQASQEVVTRSISAKIPGLDGVVKTGDKFTSTFRYDASRRDYVWATIKQGRVAKSGRLRALAVKDDLWLLQFNESRHRPTYMLVFYRYNAAKRRLQVMLPDRKFEQLRALAKSFGLELDQNRRLGGRTEDIRRFLRSHKSVPFVAAKR